MMEEHLYSFLSGSVAFPIAWGTLGEGTTTPRAAMFRTSASRPPLVSGFDLTAGRVQIDCYGKSYMEAITASREVRTAFEGHLGGPIAGAFLDSIRDLTDDDAGLLHRVSMTFVVTYRE